MMMPDEDEDPYILKGIRYPGKHGTYTETTRRAEIEATRKD